MDWKGRRGSSNIEDRRSQGGGRSAARVGGIGGAGAIIVVLLALFLGVDPAQLLGTDGGQAPGGSSATEVSEPPNFTFIFTRPFTAQPFASRIGPRLR